MACASVVIFVILGSQISTGLAVTCPLKLTPPACTGYAAGCSCGERGRKMGSTAQTTPNVNDGSQCCNGGTVSCADKQVSPGITCGAGKRFDYSKVATAAGSASADHIANCCETTPTVTCADVSCTGGGTTHMKKKTAVDAIAVTTEAACTSSCCELDTTMCVNAAGKTCAADFVAKDFTDAGGLTAAALVTFSDDATYKSNCCVAKAVCGATPTCPAYMNIDTSTTAKKCAGAVCSASECCTMKATSCVGQGSKCGSGFTLGSDMAAGKSFTTGNTDAEIKAACCTATTTSTCQAWSDAQAAGAAAAAKKGTTSQAQGASLAMFVVAVLASVIL